MNRGGSWNNDAENCSRSYRNNNWNDDRNDNIGFRLSPARRDRRITSRRTGVFPVLACVCKRDETSDARFVGSGKRRPDARRLFAFRIVTPLVIKSEVLRSTWNLTAEKRIALVLIRDYCGNRRLNASALFGNAVLTVDMFIPPPGSGFASTRCVDRRCLQHTRDKARFCLRLQFDPAAFRRFRALSLTPLMRVTTNGILNLRLAL